MLFDRDQRALFATLWRAMFWMLVGSRLRSFVTATSTAIPSLSLSQQDSLTAAMEGVKASKSVEDDPHRCKKATEKPQL